MQKTLEGGTSSEESTEAVEEVVMYSADEVMAHIDTLIAQYQYNDPEHIKALVIAANLDYISEEDLNTILSTYGYTIDELAVVYDECILDNAVALQESGAYSQGQIDSLSDENTYKNRITLESVMLNEADAEDAKWYDTMLIMRSQGGGDVNGRNNGDDIIDFGQTVMSANDNDLNVLERVCYSYAWGILYNKGKTIPLRPLILSKFRDEFFLLAGRILCYYIGTFRGIFLSGRIDQDFNNFSKMYKLTGRGVTPIITLTRGCRPWTI